MNNIEIIKEQIETEIPGIITNMYIVYNVQTNDALVIDPATNYGAEFAGNILKQKGLELKYIFLTHSHIDHTLGVNRLKDIFKHAKIIGHKNIKLNINDPEVNYLNEYKYIKFEKINVDELVGEDSKIYLGDVEFNIIETKGHTNDSISLYSEQEALLFTGDTLFVRGYGRTDLKTGDMGELVNSLKKLLKLPEETKVFPGHGKDGKIEDCK